MSAFLAPANVVTEAALTVTVERASSVAVIRDDRMVELVMNDYFVGISVAV